MKTMKTATLKMLLIGLPLFALVHPAVLAKEPTISLSPIVSYVTVDGDAQNFREHRWIKDEVTGGLDEATWDHQLGKDWLLHTDLRAIFDEEDYRINLEIAKPEVGFVRAGYREYRKYFDNTGGFYSLFNTPAFDLDRELHLDIGQIYFEAGLTLPDLPKITVGYERQFNDGTKSLLEWGAVSQTMTNLIPPQTVTRRIYPSFKDMDNTVDIFKLGLEHDIKKIHLADDFRYEHFRDRSTRVDGSANLSTSTTRAVTIHEEYNQDAFFNTFRADSYLNEKVYWSLGYLFTTLEGDGGLSIPAPPADGLDQQWQSQALAIDQDSHVVNINLMCGPFKGLTAYGGFQAEFTETDGFSDALLTQLSAGIRTNLIYTGNEKQSFEETLGVRYTKIPFTTLYAEGRWAQQDLNLAERQLRNGALYLERDTDTEVFRQDYTAGFNTAPLRRVTLSGRYRHSIRENDYNHLLDSSLGYPAFITAQDFTSDEIMARLAVRPCSKVNLAFTYRLVATDTDTTTDPVAFFSIPGGQLQSGNYDAAVYSVSATVTPISRLYVMGQFTYQDARTSAFANGSPTVNTYDGDVYSILAAAGYALDDKSDLTVEYSFSRADNFTDNSAAGLPLGLDSDLHALTAGVSRRLTANVVAQLHYGFYKYAEDSTGGLNDYEAHLAAASCTVRF